MKLWAYFDAVLLVLAAVMALTLGVVCFLYSDHLDAAPELRRGLPALVAVTGAFGVLMMLAAAAFWGQWRRATWRWLAQGVLLAALWPLSWVIGRSIAAN